jgi:DNA-binding GntR family transcriptional regulator
VALLDHYDADRGALLRVLETMSDEGIVRKDKGHGWTFLPTINNEVALRNSYDLRRMLEPNGILPGCARPHPGCAYDAEFHDTIASFTNNSFFIQAVQRQNPLRRMMKYRGYENRRRIRVWVREHLAIIDALKANKLGQASQLMTLNLEKAQRTAAKLRPAQIERNGRD